MLSKPRTRAPKPNENLDYTCQAVNVATSKLRNSIALYVNKTEDEMNVGKLGGIEAKNVAIAVCDLQEKFEPSILHWSQIVENSARIVKAAHLLNVPVLATEQYPKVDRKNCSKRSLQ